ncbi:FMN-binding negative transcriptional regulator [Idiomarina abyssalis]|uniref:FMN-binding negative transcriptional regulator n=1 Tax=Idiomarina abyssalis TaxID=86102 RepID=A0A8I1GCR5_9GAMM|nr:FMN-binding negative transcriptional regulator [Idiomarina abyssalis]MBJ7266303.1 FMN-binding negative transcriptional regulator [Idiomarina abyssalis]MBJ7272545.1 FMN-binding negative transcriptional regulator [Idiomarina abyssalis]MBJ7316537.1 FMN-binding negative transcriptional regulator [Idiomarina abyssalis]
MYVPKHFKEDDNAKLHEYIRDYGFGVLIVADEDGIEANHLPFHLSCEESDSLGTLQCHVARNNPVWQRLKDGGRVLAVFQGPDGYVSPSWYPSKAETGRVVPTWNYLAVHASGTARTIEDATWLKQHLTQLTDQHESGMKEPWQVDDAPQDFTDRLVKAIVGIEIEIETLTGKLKASQNLPERNRAGVKAGLEDSEHSYSRAMSEFVS